jgi:hypothetical protein
MTPEQKARMKIDRLLEQSGWIIQDYGDLNITAGSGVAVREFPLSTGEADYLLYADGKAIGVVEAKPEGHTLTGVETQSATYSTGFPSSFPRWSVPLPFASEWDFQRPAGRLVAASAGEAGWRNVSGDLSTRTSSIPFGREGLPVASVPMKFPWTRICAEPLTITPCTPLAEMRLPSARSAPPIVSPVPVHTAIP